MESGKSILSLLLLTGAMVLTSSPAAGGETVISKVAAAVPGNYCHMKFPAIREETLSWDRPVLKDRGTGDIIDFYGPCNHDPLGKEEIWAQRVEAQRRFAREYAD